MRKIPPVFVANLTYLIAMEDPSIEQHLQGHRDFLDKYIKKGIFLAAGPQDPRNGGIILARHVTHEQFEKILQQDPFYIHNIVTFQITAFIPTRQSEDFAPCLEFRVVDAA